MKSKKEIYDLYPAFFNVNAWGQKMSEDYIKEMSDGDSSLGVGEGCPARS